MALYTKPRYTFEPPVGGNVNVRPYGSRRVAASMFVAAFAVASPSLGSANEGVKPLKPVRHSLTNVALRAVERRMTELYDIADEEGITVSRPSHLALKNFVRGWAGIRPPAIMLMEDGTVRAIWRCDQGRQVALHFRENGKVQYVVFTLDEDGRMDRATGQTSTSTIAKKLRAFDVKELMTDASFI